MKDNCSHQIKNTRGNDWYVRRVCAKHTKLKQYNAYVCVKCGELPCPWCEVEGKVSRVRNVKLWKELEEFNE